MLQQDHLQTSSQNYARGFFRKLEIEEIKALAKAPDPSAVELRYVERFQVETPLIRTQIPTSAPENTRYFGLASNGVYDPEGNLVGDAYSLFVRASAGHKRYAKHFANPLRLNESGDPLSGDSNGGSNATTDTEYEQGHQNEEDDDQNENEADDEDDENDDEENDDEFDDDDEGKAAAKAAAEELDTEVAPTVGLYEQAIRIESLVKTTNVGRQIVTMEWGCHQLPRNTIAPKITQDSPQTVQLMEGTAPISSEVPISDAARRILSRSNYHEPLALEQDHYEDQHVTHHFIRRRSIQCLTTIMYTSLFRKQYDRAFKVLCLLMRERRVVDLRLLWMPALELLAWRVREQGARKTPVDFLDWLIVNFPNLSNHKIDKYRQLGRASTFIPVQIMVRLSLGHYRAAAEQAEQVVNTAMFNSDARCWALYGIALLKLDMEDNADKAQKCFDMCVKLGGVMSSIISESAESGSDAPSESDAQSESESGESDGSRSESEADAPSSSSSDEHNSEADETESPPTKRAKRDPTPESDTGDQSGSETESASQPFFSQGGQIGTELGSDSESEDARETSSQPFYSQGGPIGTQLGSDSEEASGNELSSQPVFTQVEKADSEPESESHNQTNGSHEHENDSGPEDEPSNSQNETQLEPDVPREASEASEAGEASEASEASDGEPELESSQPFYSQGGIGAEMGSSESEIDV